jgi:uncharacterized protein
MKQILKLVISGDVGAGKTTFVKAISEIEPITTDEAVTDAATLMLKEYTTVAMDFGLLNIDEDLALHIYATPGQRRFSFMWDVLAENCFGLIFLADASRMDSVIETNGIISYFQEHYPQIPYIVCITKLDLPESLAFQAIVELMGRDIQYLPLNANNPEEVRDAATAIISLAMS